MPTIFAFPKKGIFYNESLYAAMQDPRVRVEHGHFALRWLLRHARRGDVLHFHWPSFAYHHPHKAVALYRFVRWVCILCVMRSLGVRVFWTAHNVLPHDRAPIPRLDVWGRRLIVAFSSIVFVHGETAGRKLSERFPGIARKLVLIPHGHWIGSYPTRMSRAETRSALQIDEARFVYLFIGLCKPYKNLEGLIDAFRRLPGDALLLIAGRFPDEAYRKAIHAQASDDPRIRLVARFIPHDEVSVFLTAADVVVAPYRETLTSGAAMLAMSFGRPIVSVATGHLLDVVTESTGILYAPSEADALGCALAQARTIAFSEAEILRHVATFTFDDAARITAEMASKPSVREGRGSPLRIVC